jgi:hypothetical protein
MCWFYFNFLKLYNVENNCKLFLAYVLNLVRPSNEGVTKIQVLLLVTTCKTTIRPTKLGSLIYFGLNPIFYFSLEWKFSNVG